MNPITGRVRNAHKFGLLDNLASVDYLYRVVGLPNGQPISIIEQPIAYCVGHDIRLARLWSTISQIAKGRTCLRPFLFGETKRGMQL